MLSVASLLGSLQELNQMGPLNFRGTEVIKKYQGVLPNGPLSLNLELKSGKRTG